MQTDIDLNAIFLSLGTSVFSSSVAYGVMKTKIARLEKDMEDQKAASRFLVTRELFDAVMVQLKDDVAELKSSVKELLTILHERNH